MVVDWGQGLGTGAGDRGWGQGWEWGYEGAGGEANLTYAGFATIF